LKFVLFCFSAVRCVQPSQPGLVLALGEGDTGQLGLGPDVMDRSKPARVNLPADVIQICAGGMHSVCLTVNGEVSHHNILSYRLSHLILRLYFGIWSCFMCKFIFCWCGSVST